MKILKAIWYFFTEMKMLATVVFVVLSAIMFALTNIIESEALEIAGYICLLYPIGFMLVALVYAFIINPIREYKSNHKRK